MGKALVIVESPAKAKTINKYLGNDFIVKSSVGHIRDLPVSGQGTTVDPKARAAEAAKTRKMSPDKKAAHKKATAKKPAAKKTAAKKPAAKKTAAKKATTEKKTTKK